MIERGAGQPYERQLLDRPPSHAARIACIPAADDRRQPGKRSVPSRPSTRAEHGNAESFRQSQCAGISRRVATSRQRPARMITTVCGHSQPRSEATKRAMRPRATRCAPRSGFLDTTRTSSHQGPNVRGQRRAGTQLARLDDAVRRVLCTVGLGVTWLLNIANFCF